jgi:polysaccharide biosynthesis protein PslF
MRECANGRDPDGPADDLIPFRVCLLSATGARPYRKAALVPRSIGLLGTYPPTRCGIATFAHSLVRNIDNASSGTMVGVVRVIDAAGEPVPGVVGSLRTDLSGTELAAAEALNAFDVAIVQHEYGIYGGADGDQLLAVLDHVRVPVVVVAHTVLAQPTPRQRTVLAQIVAASDAVVVMTDAARDRLIARYGADPDRVKVIRHGATVRVVAGRLVTRSPLVLTWGLLGPGKGVEWAIDGLPRLRGLSPRPSYVVAGQTHPRVREHQGEAYRHMLQRRAADAGVADMVRFDDSYVDEDVLSRLIERADVVVLPYDSVEQVTSGVLVEAVAANKLVVATAFPHAVELLGSGAGLVVPHRDGRAIGEALYQVLTEPGHALRMRAQLARIAPELDWPSVADQYLVLAAGLLAEPTAVLG